MTCTPCEARRRMIAEARARAGLKGVVRVMMPDHLRISLAPGENITRPALATADNGAMLAQIHATGSVRPQVHDGIG